MRFKAIVTYKSGRKTTIYKDNKKDIYAAVTDLLIRQNNLVSVVDICHTEDGGSNV